MPTKAEAAEAAKNSTKKRYRVTDYYCSKCEAQPGEYCELVEGDYAPRWYPQILHYVRIEEMRKAAYNDRLKKGQSV